MTSTSGSNVKSPRATWSKPTGHCRAHGGELEGTPPTGKPVYVDGQLLSRIVEGKFVEEWVHWDTLGLLRQIGAVPPPQG
jgi:predicted ester cyclase